MYGQRRWLTRSLSDPTLPSSWTRRAPSSTISSHPTSDSLQDTRPGGLPQSLLNTQPTSTSPIEPSATNLASVSNSTTLKQHGQPPTLNDGQLTPQRLPQRTATLKDETRACRQAGPAHPSRHPKNSSDPTAQGTSKHSKRSSHKFTVPSLSNVYTPHLFEIRLTPVNRRVPKHLRPTASFTNLGGDSIDPSQQSTPRSFDVRVEIPPRKRKLDVKSSHHTKPQEPKCPSGNAPPPTSLLLGIKSPNTPLSPKADRLASPTMGPPSAHPQQESELDMQATIRIIKSPSSACPENNPFLTEPNETASEESVKIDLSESTDHGEEQVIPEPDVPETKVETSVRLEAETVIEEIAKAVIEAAEELASEVEAQVKASLGVTEKRESETEECADREDPVVPDFPLEIKKGQDEVERLTVSETEPIQTVETAQETGSGASAQPVSLADPEVSVEATPPAELKMEETPHVAIKVIETPQANEHPEPADTTTPWLPGTKSIGSTTTAVESKRPESLAETLYERSIPGTQKSNLRSRSRAKSRIEEPESLPKSCAATTENQIPAPNPTKPPPAPQPEAKPKPTEPKESAQKKPNFAAGDDFDTDNEPSWAWEELLKQIDEEEEKYKKGRHAADVNMWWIGFELAWEANVRKGRPLRSWLDVEKNWPRDAEREREAKVSETVSDPSRLPKKVPSQQEEAGSKTNADPSGTNPSPQGEKDSVVTSSTSTNTSSLTTQKDKEENQRRSSTGSLKGDIWKMWKETEQRWAEEERTEKEKPRGPEPAPAAASQEPPRSKLFNNDTFPRSRYSRRRGSAWEERPRKPEETRKEAGGEHSQPQPQPHHHSYSYTQYPQQQQAYPQHQGHCYSQPFSQWQRRQSDAAPPPPPPQPNTTQHSGTQSRRDTFSGTQTRPKKEPRIPLKIRIPETPMGSAWRAYESRWETLLNSQGPITFASVPWPTHHRPADPTAITIYNIAAFLLSPEHSNVMTARDRLRNAVRKWHTDKFTRFANRIVPEDKAMIDEGVGIVARALTQLLELEKRRSG